MLESTRRSVFRHYIVSNAEKPGPVNPNQCDCIINYYLSPEDTTDNAAERRAQIPKYATVDIRGMLKAVFWIAISIGLALLIGKLC